jgi:hypothetical protein
MIFIHWRKIRTCSYHIYYLLIIFICLFLARQPLVDQGLLIHEISRLHTATHTQSMWPLWTSYQLVAETSTGQQSQQTDIYAPGGIRTHSLSRRAAADLRLRPRGQWDRFLTISRNIRSGVWLDMAITKTVYKILFYISIYKIFGRCEDLMSRLSDKFNKIGVHIK